MFEVTFEFKDFVESAFTALNHFEECLLIFLLPQFDNKSVQSFTEDDIVNMYPIVKHINPRQVLNYFLFSLNFIYKLSSEQLMPTTSTQLDSPRFSRVSLRLGCLKSS